MKQTAATVIENPHRDGEFAVRIEGTIFNLAVPDDEHVEVGDEITVKYDSADQFATMLSTSDVLAEQIYHTLTLQRFSDWYGDNGNFGKHILGDLPTVTRETVINDIKRLFRIG
jgi:hypothetical protein